MTDSTIVVSIVNNSSHTIYWTAANTGTSKKTTDNTLDTGNTPIPTTILCPCTVKVWKSSSSTAPTTNPDLTVTYDDKGGAKFNGNGLNGSSGSLTATSVTLTVSGGGWPWWAWLLLAIGIILIIILLIWVFTRGKKKNKPEATPTHSTESKSLNSDGSQTHHNETHYDDGSFEGERTHFNPDGTDESKSYTSK